MLKCRLTVFFEGPFWVGVLERQDGRHLEAGRYVFGPEPKEYDVRDFIFGQRAELRMDGGIKVPKEMAAKVNPKRRQREVQSLMKQRGAGTKAQQAVSMTRELKQEEKKKKAKENKREEKERRFELRQKKKKEAR